MSLINYSAFIPCHNNASTIGKVINALIKQSLPPSEIFVIDDASTDNSIEVISRYSVSLIRNPNVLGRGAVRALAFRIASFDLVLSCDATNTLDFYFCESAIHYFSDPSIAAVFGRIQDLNPVGAAGRWRARHLYKSNINLKSQYGASLSTFGAMFCRSAVLDVGNFNVRMKHSEDVELSKRLYERGYTVVFDPSLSVISISRNTIPEVLERYWRWYAGLDEAVSVKAYLKTIIYSIKHMMWIDLKDGDFASVLISLLCPHYQFWKSLLRKIKFLSS